jgi:hypothetical protein
MGEAGGSRPGLSRVVRREIAAEADAREKEGGYWWRTAGGSRQLSRCSALSPEELVVRRQGTGSL